MKNRLGNKLFLEADHKHDSVGPAGRPSRAGRRAHSAPGPAASHSPAPPDPQLRLLGQIFATP